MTIRITALSQIVQRIGLSLSLLGCSGSTEKKTQSCEQAVYSEQDLNRAFTQAKEKLAQEGYEVRSLLWNDEEKFTRLTNYLVSKLNCTPQSQQALREASTCGETDLKSYRSSAYYCGPCAVTGDSCLRLDPGECLNQVCYTHDLCYDALLQSSPSSGLCLWSEHTKSCDDDFSSGYWDCVNDQECGFWCRVTNVIAASLTAIEAGYDAVGSGCLWTGECSCCEQPDGGSESGLDGGMNGDCFTQYCNEAGCVFSEPFDGQQLNLCRWRIDRGNPLVEDGALQLSNNSGVVSDLPPRSCSQIEVEYRSRIDLQSFYYLNLGQVQVMYSPKAFPNQLAAACSFGTPKVLEGVDATQWQTIRLDVQEESTQVYVNDVLKKTLSCGQQTLGNMFITGPFDSSLFSVDYVKKKCE